MFRSIVTKLWASIFFLVVGIMLFFTVILSYRIDQINLAHEIELMTELEQQWADELSSGRPFEEVQREAIFWGNVSRFKITVYDQNRIVQLSSDEKHTPPGQKLRWTHAKKTLINGQEVFTGYSPDYDMKMTATFRPVTLRTGENMVIMIHASNHELMEINRVIKRITALLAGLFLLFSAIIAWALSRWLARPLITIRKAALRMAQGDFDTRVDLKRRDELGDLAGTIDNLAARLKRSISTLYDTNRELNDVLQKWKDFLADVSHELRTPLFLISGYSEAIMDRVVDEDKARQEYLPVIQKEALRLQKMVDDLTRVEKIARLDRTEVDLYDLIRQTVQPFAILLQERSLKLTVSESIKGLPPVFLDPGRFSEVIFNLVDNAIRYTPSGGAISINAQLRAEGRASQTVSPGVLEMQLSDTGAGIPPEHLPRLFDRFYRVDKARSRAEGGTGLGLAIVKKIVGLHGGEISVESEVGKGTTFKISIPVPEEKDR